MQVQKLTGAAAGALKYDVLTALSVMGMAGTPTLQTSMLRLVALVTARYNWRLDEFSVGQRDMARMWSVNERTVKREMKRLTGDGILLCTRAGVRGRVGAYRLNFRRIAELSCPHWHLVGPDFAARMQERYGRDEVKVVQLRAPAPQPKLDAGPWGAAMGRLASEHPALFGAWFAQLTFEGYDQGVLRLRAPSPFVQRYVETHHLGLLLEAAAQELGPVMRVEFA